jgi:hypothetical protein
MMTNTLFSFIDKLLLILLPKTHWYWRKEEIQTKSVSYNATIESYEQMSKAVRDEIDRNHFATVLIYEKQSSSI